MTGAGMYGCPLCNEPPPHGHDLGTILNARYYCEGGSKHEWGPPSRWLKRVHCARCGYRQPRSDRPEARRREMDAFIRKHGGIPVAERTRLTEIDGPAHDSLLHLHEHDDRPPSAVPHEHPHPWLPGEDWQHQHLHRHAYDLPALKPLEMPADDLG